MASSRVACFLDEAGPSGDAPCMCVAAVCFPREAASLEKLGAHAYREVMRLLGKSTEARQCLSTYTPPHTNTYKARRCIELKWRWAKREAERRGIRAKKLVEAIRAAAIAATAKCKKTTVFSEDIRVELTYLVLTDVLEALKRKHGMEMPRIIVVLDKSLVQSRERQSGLKRSITGIASIESRDSAKTIGIKPSRHPSRILPRQTQKQPLEKYKPSN
ncbi:hypothetical protein [Pyrodictium abyssi]|uniref:DUF3800 domain-containing protein n=1 Tax=Pyrodictium abyssi TaxID=54256 RepID=A0ABM8IZ15_9CREN|nr:hypothetical protein PABY_14580 [Pyrodictium abyssi]